MSALRAEAAARPFVRLERNGAVAVLTLDRPERRNSLSDAMLAALQEALDAVAADSAVNAVVLAAAGPVFCAGHDLRELTAARAGPDGGRAHFAATFAACARVMTAIVRLPQPVIAAVQGVATAAGCQLVASADLAVAAADARFCTPGVSIGLFCSTPMVALSRDVSRKAALEMLLTADLVPADEARRFGLVNRVVDPQRLMTEAMALAQGIAARPPATVRLGKAAFNRQAGLDLDAAYKHTAAVMVDNMLLAEAEEGIGAFLEKRPPRRP